MAGVFLRDIDCTLGSSSYPLAGWRAMARGSSRLSLMMLVTRLPSKSAKAIVFVPVSVQYR